MWLAVLAEIHGNRLALEALLTDIRQHGVDGVLVAGNSTGGPEPVETFDILRALDARTVRGNSEDYSLAYDSGDAPEA